MSPKQQHQSQQLLATTEPMMYLTGSYKKGSRSSPSALQTQSADPDVADISPTLHRGHTDGASSRASKKWETCQISVFTSFSARMHWSGSRQALTTSSRAAESRAWFWSDFACFRLRSTAHGSRFAPKLYGSTPRWVSLDGKPRPAQAGQPRTNVNSRQFRLASLV